jgi:hypothetical protein
VFDRDDPVLWRTVPMRDAPDMTMGEQFGVPTYPAAMSALPQPFMVPTRWHPARVTAAVLCFVALVLVVVSTFLPLYSGSLSFGGGGGDFGDPDSLEVTFTPWGAEYSSPEMNATPDNVPRLGYPMVFAALAMACAVAACWYAASPAASRTAGRAAGVLNAVSSAFLIGTVWTTALIVSAGVDSFLLLGSVGNGLQTDASYLAGYWFLLTATLLSFAAAILSFLPTRQPAWQPPPPVNPFAATPPYGIALPTETQLTYAGPQAVVSAIDPLTSQPLAVDPLTGLPLPQGPARPPVTPPSPYANGYTPQPAEPVPFTADPVLPVNGTSPAPQAVDLSSLPAAPPSPDSPPGPAIPASEDPLAEPPKN